MVVALLAANPTSGRTFVFGLLLNRRPDYISRFVRTIVILTFQTVIEGGFEADVI